MRNADSHVRLGTSRRRLVRGQGSVSCWQGHVVYNRGHDIDRALLDVIEEAVRTRATVVEIIPGKGSGQLKKRVLRFLDQKEIKAQYDRVEKDSRNFGRVFVHFRWK